MRISLTALILALTIPASAAWGQAASAVPKPALQGAAQTQPAAAGPGQTAAPVNTASSLMRPSLVVVQDTLNGLRLEKWKKGSVRDEAGEHVASLLKDMQTNLPPLMTAADGAPGQLSTAIPLVKHLDAFYDVLLRVEEAARVSAPGDQVGALQQAMLQLNQARLALDDHLQSDAAVQEKQVADLQVALKTARADAQAKATVAAAPLPCKPATPAKKKAAVKKPAASTGGTGTPGATTPAKPAPAKTTPAKTAAPAQPAGQKPPQ